MKNYVNKNLLIKYMDFFQETEVHIPFLYLENSIAFQTVIQELRTVCDDRKRSAPADETLHSGSLKIRGGTPAQEMGLCKGRFLKV